MERESLQWSGREARRGGEARRARAATRLGDDLVVDHRDDERIVELVRLPTRVEADVALATVRDAGLQASVAYGDAEGWAPHLGVFQGHRVLVFEGDLEAARAALAEAGIQQA